MRSIVAHPALHGFLMSAIVGTAGCGPGDASGGAEVVRDTLPNGAVRLRYAALPAPTSVPAAVELSIGEIEGEAYEIFGDVRGIEADPEGNIYILDYQASEVRAFDAGGNYLRTLTRKGGGPGELSSANGMILADEGTLWIQDHGKWQMIGIDLTGEEVARHPMHVRSFGYVYRGTVDDHGRLWREASHSDEEPTFPPPEGLNEGSSRSYLKWFDPGTGASDSVFVGEAAYRSFVTHGSRGSYSFLAIPFSSRASFVIDPAGGSWHTHGDAYRIVRLGEMGDTAVVIEVDVQARLVTDEERQRFIEGDSERSPDQRRTMEEVVGLAPGMHPVIDQLVLDDEDRLWVRRVVADGENPLYDVFTRDGEYLGSVRLGFQPAPYLPPRIRNGKIYMLVRDSLDVPTVVRTTVPPLGAQMLIGAIPMR